MKLLIAATMTAFLAGCIAGGTRVDESKLASLRKGVTTEAEAVTALGTPNTVTTNGDMRILSYAWFHAQPRASSFIPVVGAFVGGADSLMEIVTLRFDQNGILSEIDTTQSATGMATGIPAGTQPTIPDQPSRER